MDETLKNALLLVLGAALSFVPQEIVRRSEAKREEMREARAAKRERRQIVWQREMDRLTNLEMSLARFTDTAATKEPKFELSELAYLHVAVMLHPELRKSQRAMMVALSTCMETFGEALALEKKGQPTDRVFESQKYTEAKAMLIQNMHEFLLIYREKIDSLS